MHNETAIDIFKYIEMVYSRTGIHSAFAHMNPSEFEKTNSLKDEGRPKES